MQGCGLRVDEHCRRSIDRSIQCDLRSGHIRQQGVDKVLEEAAGARVVSSNHTTIAGAPQLRFPPAHPRMLISNRQQRSATATDMYEHAFIQPVRQKHKSTSVGNRNESVLMHATLIILIECILLW